MVMDLARPSIDGSQFHRIAALLQRTAGIALADGKTDLVKARLDRRLRTLGMAGYDQYLDYLDRDGPQGELNAMVDALTTNTTSFFREQAHFDFLQEQVLPGLVARGQEMCFWSAGCSSGEEPYSLAAVLADALGARAPQHVRILATDICREVLVKAEEGIASEEALSPAPAGVKASYFSKLPGPPPARYQVKPALKQLITFARLNLMDPWPMRGAFDVILCRNVMIYFDLPTRTRLVRRFEDMLALGGYLFIGHSESLSSMRHGLSYVQPAVYRREHNLARTA